MILMIETVG